MDGEGSGREGCCVKISRLRLGRQNKTRARGRGVIAVGSRGVNGVDCRSVGCLDAPIRTLHLPHAGSPQGRLYTALYHRISRMCPINIVAAGQQLAPWLVHSTTNVPKKLFFSLGKT